MNAHAEYLLRAVHADLQGVFAQSAVSRQDRKRPLDLLLPLLAQVLQLVPTAHFAPDVLRMAKGDGRSYARNHGMGCGTVPIKYHTGALFDRVCYIYVVERIRSTLPFGSTLPFPSAILTSNCGESHTRAQRALSLYFEQLIQAQTRHSMLSKPSCRDATADTHPVSVLTNTAVRRQLAAG